MVPSADALIRLVNPQMAPELKGLVLNACHTSQMARRIHQSLPHLAIVCWEGPVLDGAAKEFSRGFFSAFADSAPGATSVSTAFDAGRAAFLRAGWAEGNPADYLHPPGHEHHQMRAARIVFDWKNCNPPVHGVPCLVAKSTWAAQAAAAARVAQARKAEERKAEKEAAARAMAEKALAAEEAAEGPRPDDEAAGQQAMRPERGRPSRDRDRGRRNKELHRSKFGQQ